MNHDATAPSRSFWEDMLFFGRFEEIEELSRTPLGVEELLARSYKGKVSQEAVEEIVERSGGGLGTRRSLAMVGAFTEMKHSEAIEYVALAALGAEVVEAHRTLGGHVRRHALMALLWEQDPQHMLSVDLWHGHLRRRRTRYRLVPPLAQPLVFEPEHLESVARDVLVELADQATSGCRDYDEVRVVPCQSPGDVLIGLREWPGRSTGRDSNGDVRTVELPEWTVLHLTQGGLRLEVSDRRVDRAARYAGALVRELTGTDAHFEVVLEELSDRKLREFLDRITSPRDGTFPLVELVASVPWRPHQHLTLSGTSTHTTEQLVSDLRTLHHPFARDWRTVQSAKVLFEGRYKIQVQFPPSGQPQALTFSDVDRSTKVTARFTELLQAHLGVEVSSKARRGSSLPSGRGNGTPRKNTLRWWQALLAPQTDAPAEWLEQAVRVAEGKGLIRASWSRVFPCGSPYVDRRAVPVDSLDCDGEVELPCELPEPHDPLRAEADGECWCSRGLHRWTPRRYGLPTLVRVRVEPDHQAVWEHLLQALAHFGDVRELPARPGVAALRLDRAEVNLVYVPLVEDEEELDPASFGRRTPVAWVRGPGVSPPGLSDGAVSLASVLADSRALATVWGGPLERRSRPMDVERAPLVLRDGSVPLSGPITRVLELTEEGVTFDGRLVATPRHHAVKVLDALRQAAAEDEGDGRVREPRTWEQLDAYLLPEERAGRKSAWQTWMSRTRKALVEATGDEEIGKRVIVTRGGGYRLGDAFVVSDRRSILDDYA